MKNEAISAFAYMTAKQIEFIIDQETNHLRETNNEMAARILGFRTLLERLGINLTDASEVLALYDEYFGINTQNANNFSNEEEGS